MTGAYPSNSRVYLPGQVLPVRVSTALLAYSWFVQLLAMTPAMLLSQALQALFQPLQQSQSLVKEIMSHSLNEEVSQPLGVGGGGAGVIRNH